jgi:hypothetical protein
MKRVIRSDKPITSVLLSSRKNATLALSLDVAYLRHQQGKGFARMLKFIPKQRPVRSTINNQDMLEVLLLRLDYYICIHPQSQHSTQTKM